MPTVSPEKTFRLLIVDDEQPIRILFSMALERENYESREAAGGHEALEILEAEEFDLVLLDLSMPGLSGIDVLKQMRKRGDLTRVMIVSAYIPGAAILKASSLGVTTFVGKPITLNFLREIVAEKLENEGGSNFFQACRKAEEMDFRGAIELLDDDTLANPGQVSTWRTIFEKFATDRSVSDLTELEPVAEKLVRQGS